MKKLKKILSILTLIVLVGSDFLTSFSYALDDMLEDSVVVQIETEEEIENVENEEENMDEEYSEVVYEDESIEDENEVGETVEGVTGDIAEELTGFAEELTGEMVERTGTGEENVIEEIKYNEEPIIGEKTYDDVTLRVEALTGNFPEGTELAIEPIKEKIVDVTNHEESREGGIVVADAENFSTYVLSLSEEDTLRVLDTATVTHNSNAGVSYTLNGNENFTAGTITITDGTNTITMLDRNLGATVAGVGCKDLNGNCPSTDSTYGYYFQWGNNYGFDPKSTRSKSNTQVEASSLNYDPSHQQYFSSSIFIYGYNNWLNDPNVVDLWGGSVDDKSSSYPLTQSGAAKRRGPCPENFHVPSYGELNQVKSMMGDGAENAHSKLLIPFAGYHRGDFYLLGESIHLWSSSPREFKYPVDKDKSYLLNMMYKDEYDLISIFDFHRVVATPVRCFYDLYQSYTPSSTFTLTFDSQGGSEVGTGIAGEGQTRSRPDDPTRIGYVFVNWYTSTGYDTLFDFTTPATANATAYAKWQGGEGVTYTVTFDANRGTFANLSTPQIVANGDLLTEPTTELTGYRLDGWYDENDNKWNFSQDVVTQNVTLKAKWEYDLPYGELDVYMIDSDKNLTKKVMMDRNLGASARYDRLDFTSPNFSSLGFVYQWGNNWGFARCTNDTLCHGEGTPNPDTISQAVGDWVGYVPSKYASKKFHGSSNTSYNGGMWILSNNGDYGNNLWGLETGTPEAMQGPCPDGYYLPLGDDYNTLYTKWKDIRGYSRLETDDQIRDFTADFLFPLAGSHKKGRFYEYDQGLCADYWTNSLGGTDSTKANNFWFCRDKSNGYKGVGYSATQVSFRNNGSTVRCFKDSTNANLEIDAKGGKQALITIIKEGGVSTIDTIKEPTQKTADNINLIFDGWYTSPNFEPSTMKTGGDTLSDSDTTLYAKWNCPDSNQVFDGISCVNPQTITFNANDGSFDVGGESQNSITKSLVYGVMYDYSDLPTPTRPGYAFKGWYADFDGVDDSVDYGTSFKFSDKISIHVSAYMEDWSGFGDGDPGNKIISCMSGNKGWEINSKNNNVGFGCADNGTWNSANSTVLWSSLEEGWHDFDAVFDGHYIKLYLDDVEIAQSTEYSNPIKYSSSDSILLGVRPGFSNYFNGKIKDVIIQNSDQKIESTDVLLVPHQDVTYYALWEEMLDGTVTFESNNPVYGTVSELTVTKPYGTEITISDNTVIIGEDTVTAITEIAPTGYTNSFENWTFSSECGEEGHYAVAPNCTITANFSQTENTYNITWSYKASDGTQTGEVMKVKYNILPEHVDAPTVTVDHRIYTFASWTPMVEEATADVTYTATYTETCETGYDDKGGECVIHEYDITWLNEDGTLIDTTIVEYGVVPTHADVDQPADAEFTYEFIGWTPTPVAVTGDTSYRATYKYIKNKYTITWLDEDLTLIDTTSVEYGALPTHSNPSKPADDEYIYKFAGWSPELVAVTGEATYTATYTAEKKEEPTGDGGMSGGGRGGNADSEYNQHGSAEENVDGNGYTGDEVIDDFNKDVVPLYKWTYENKITTMDTLEEADPDGLVTRGHLAKMVVNYMVNVLGRKVPYDITYNCLYRGDNESTWESDEIRDYATKACAFGVMGINMENNEFLPNSIVTRAEFGTVMSRVLWGDKYNIIDTDNRMYYEDHLQALKSEDILTQINDPEARREIRKWVWLVFRRVLEKKK